MQIKYLITSGIIFLLGILGLLSPIRGLIHYTFFPVEFGLTQAARDIKEAGKFFLELKDIRQENLKLLVDNEKLKSQVLNLQKIAEENKVLKRQLNLQNKDFFDKKLLVSGVLGNMTDLTGSTIVLDKGTRQGVRLGNNVIVSNYLIGIVQKVESERSIVALITSPDVSITCLNYTSVDKTSGLCKGQYGTSVLMSRILPNEELNIGDIITTSGRDGLFQPGFIVGNISDIIETSSEPLKSALIEVNINLAKLDKVFVILD